MVDITSRLERDISIVDSDGKPSFKFQRYWQDTIQGLIDALTAVEDAQAAAVAADAAAAAANVAAATANSAATAVTADSNLANSYVTGVTISATDAGADVTVSISAHTRVYGDGTSVAVNASSVTGLAYSTLYYFYYDDAARTGGAITAVATTSQTTAAQSGNRHTIGKVTTPAALGADVPGFFVYPPGVGLIP